MSINRHLARGIALQILFELDVNNNLSLNKEGLEKIIERQAEEFAGEKDDGFIFDLLSTIEERVSTLDDIISRAAPEWPLEKINVMDRNILRIGLAELLFNSENVPPKVAIDEAIELAKNYSSVNSHKFVNGVLGSVYKEMGEPRKEETSQKKSLNLETINLAGGLVYSIHDGKIFLAFIKDIFKHWTLPKGKLLEGEDIMIGALRKIKEEIGINVSIKDKLKENTYIANTTPKSEDGKEEPQKKFKVQKHVHYFLAEGKHEPLKLEEGNTGLVEAKWFSLDQIEELNFYEDIKPILAIGIEKINEIYENKL